MAIAAKADSGSAVEVAMASRPARPGNRLVLFWATRTTPCDGWACVAVPLAATPGPRTYALAVGKHCARRGGITQLRVGPWTVTETAVRITRVRLLL